MAQRRDLGKEYGKEFDKRNPQVREREVYANTGWSGIYRWAPEWEQNIC